MQHKPFVITIVGPESSGKTTLARQLADHYRCPWVPEYAREYLEGLGRSYTAEDLGVIAEGQLESIVRVTSGDLAFLPPGPLKGVQSNEGLKYGIEQFKPGVLTFLREEFNRSPRQMVIVDSGMMSLRMWARIKYGTTIPFVEEALSKDVTSLYLLTRPLDHWEPDPLREAPTLLDRAWIYNQFLQELSIIQSTQSTLK